MAGKKNGKRQTPRPAPIAMPNAPSIPGPKTPKTPQDEAIAFFSGEGDGEPVQVWELWLEDDGGPSEAKSVSPLRISLVTWCCLLTCSTSACLHRASRSSSASRSTPDPAARRTVCSSPTSPSTAACLSVACGRSASSRLTRASKYAQVDQLLTTDLFRLTSPSRRQERSATLLNTTVPMGSATLGVKDTSTSTRS